MLTTANSSLTIFDEILKGKAKLGIYLMEKCESEYFYYNSPSNYLVNLFSISKL